MFRPPPKVNFLFVSFFSFFFFFLFFSFFSFFFHGLKYTLSFCGRGCDCRTASVTSIVFHDDTQHIRSQRDEQVLDVVGSPCLNNLRTI